MSLKLTTWNLREGLALAERSQPIVENVVLTDSDVVLLTDAYWLDNPLHGAQRDRAEEAKGKFQEEGYVVLEAEYDDDRPWPRHYMMLLSRLAVTETAVVRFGERNGLSAKITEPETGASLQLIGVHFDDRGEMRRLRQATDMIQQVNPHEPTALVGDFNAMHADDLRSRLLRRYIVKTIANRLPNERAKVITSRVAAMAAGSTLRLIERAGFRDIDTRHQPTMPACFPVLDLDHCFVSEQVQAKEFKVQPYNPASDHRAVSVEISL